MISGSTATYLVNTSSTYGGYQSGSSSPGYNFDVIGDVATYSTNTIDDAYEVL